MLKKEKSSLFELVIGNPEESEWSVEKLATVKAFAMDIQRKRTSEQERKNREKAEMYRTLERNREIS